MQPRLGTMHLQDGIEFFPDAVDKDLSALAVHQPHSPDVPREVSFIDKIREHRLLAASLHAKPRPFPAIGGGLIVGVLDLTYAMLVYSPQKPILIPQTIASGVLGMKSYSGGAQAAALGVVLHFVIALGAATVYYLGSCKLAFLVDRAVLFGLIYGALVYLFMHLVVLPLSAVPHRDMPLIYKACEFVEHWFCVGLPIALSVRHYSR